MAIKVIDVFAGPGGLSEGFAAVKDYRGGNAFENALSIEAELWASATLRLRTFYRSFHAEVPPDYYQCLRQEISRQALYEGYPSVMKEVDRKCWNARLGPGGEPTQRVRDRIHKALGSTESWVLIGGPPCQAYSIAGRSRNKGNPKYDPEKDLRQRLYVEYLQILADRRPAVFVMENVKGILSARVDNSRLFVRILEDLRDPVSALRREGRLLRRTRKCGYRVFSLVLPREFENGDTEGAVIQAERYGVPQARHRVVLLGIRDDLRGIKPGTLEPRPTVSMISAVGDLPPLRSGLSRIKDSAEAWENCLRSQITYFHGKWKKAYH